MPFTPEQKRRIVELNGLNPDEYDFNESDETLVPRPKTSLQPSGAPTTTVELNKAPEVPSILDTARRGATESLLPTLAGLGATAGAAALGPPGWLGAGLALLAGTGAGIGAGALQKSIVPEQTQQDLFLRPEDIEQNKYTSILSGFLPGMLAFRPSLHELPQVLGGIKALPRALSAGEAALTTGQKAALFNAAANTLPSAGLYGYDVLKGNREFDLGSLAAETLPGLLMTKPTAIGRRLGFGDPGFRPETSRVLTPAEPTPTLTPAEPTPTRRPAALLPEETLSTLQRRQEVSQSLNEPVPPSRVEIRRQMEEQRLQQAEQEAAVARQKALKDADYRRMEAEVEAENQKAIAAEMEVERLKAENERRKIDLATGLKKGYGTEAPLAERLQTRVEARRLTEPEARPAVEPEAPREIPTEPPLTEAEQIQEDYDLGKRYSEASDMPPLDSTPIETLKDADKQRIRGEIERVAKLRRMKVRYVDGLKKGDKEVLGRYDPTTREFLLNRKLYAGDTGPHEIAHGRILDLLESGSEKDKSLVLKGLEFADEKGRKFKAVEDYKALSPEEQMAIEENFTRSVGPEGYRRQRQELWGKKRERFVEWINQVGNHFKVKTGAADSNELYQHFVERQMFDAPDSGRVELSGVKIPVVKKPEIRKEEKKGLPFSEESDLPPAKDAGDFFTVSSRVLSSRNLLGLDREKSIDVGQLRGTLMNKIPPLEQQLLKDSGIEKLSGKMSPREMEEWIRENGPKVETKNYGMEGKVSEAKREYDRMTHEWLDQLDGGSKSAVLRAAQLMYEGNSSSAQKELNTLSARNYEKAEQYIKLSAKLNDELGQRDTSPRATSAYDTVSAFNTREPMPDWTTSKERKNVQRVDVVLPQKKISYEEWLKENNRGDTQHARTVWENNIANSISETGYGRPLWHPDNLHENLPNTLGWAMLQYKTGPNGEKIAVVVEAQSRWGQNVRHEKDRYKAGVGQYPLEKDHPLLKDYNRLILKAAIAQAKKEGATHILISDAETAMMTEGHDLQARALATPDELGKYLVVDEEGRTDSTAFNNIEDAQERADRLNDWYGNRKGTHGYIEPKLVTEADIKPSIEQEGGMRLNYDKVLPQIAEDLIGAKGERVSLGEHKNAFERAGTIDRTDEEGFQQWLRNENKPRKNLVFRNPDGSPKTDVSGLLYPIESAPSDFSLTAKRFSEESDLPPIGSNPPRTGALTRLTSSATKAIKNLGGETAAHVSTQSEKYFALKSLYEGKYANNVQADIVSADPEVRQRVDQYGREMHTEGSSDITLTPEEQNLYDSMREYLVNVADENTAREIKKDPNYWPAILDTRVAEMWSKAPNSPEGRRYQREWMQHAQQQVDKGRANYTHDELKDILDEYMAALGSDGREGSLEFGALRKAAGLGLPISMQDNNLLSRFTRYGRRVAKDMAFREAVEMDPTMRYMFRVKDDAGQVLTEPPTLPSGNLATDEIRGSRPLQDIQRAMYEEFPNKRSPRINAISRAVSSSMLGTATGIRDVVTGPNVILPIIGTRNARALAEGFANIRQGYDESFQYGARKLRMNELEFGSAASPDTLTRWFNEVADAARKYSGREALEQFQRAYFWNVSKIATVSEFGRAANGNETSIKWLKDHSITVDNIDSYIGQNAADIPEEVINRIAKEVTEKAAGTYDPRGLPAGVMEGPLAPFFSLSRWSIERTNRIVEDVLAPARSGNFVPLLTYTAGSFLTGAAIQELNELMSGGKRGFSPTLKEAEAAQEGQVRAVVNLLQLGSFAGIIGDMMKSATEAYAGHLPRGLSFPLADFVSQTLGQNLSDYFAALQAGEDKTEASLGLAERLLVDSIQSARMVSYLTWRQNEVGRKNEYRDFRLWKELSGQKAPESSIGRPNEFLNKREKAFKRASSVEEIGKTFEPALEAAVNKAQTPEDLKRNVEGLGRNSYQTWPTEPREMVKYYEYLKESQGEEAAAASFESFLQQRELNKLKSRMVPKL